MGPAGKERSSPPISQAELMERVLPLIKSANLRFEKHQLVHARPAIPGETIVSIPADGHETTNTAKADEVVVRNLTGAQEEYIVSGPTFAHRYSEIEPVDGEWALYTPRGEVMAIEVTRELADQLGVGEEFCIIAAWGSEQRARVGDKLVATLPDLSEVYRIAREEFNETYRLVTRT